MLVYILFLYKKNNPFCRTIKNTLLFIGIVIVYNIVYYTFTISYIIYRDLKMSDNQSLTKPIFPSLLLFVPEFVVHLPEFVAFFPSLLSIFPSSWACFSIYTASD